MGKWKQHLEVCRRTSRAAWILRTASSLCKVGRRSEGKWSPLRPLTAGRCTCVRTRQNWPRESLAVPACCEGCYFLFKRLPTSVPGRGLATKFFYTMQRRDHNRIFVEQCSAMWQIADCKEQMFFILGPPIVVRLQTARCQTLLRLPMLTITPGLGHCC